MQILQGDVYEIDHEYKGQFTMRISKVTATIIQGVIVEGIAKMCTRENLGPGDEVKMFRVRCTIKKAKE